MHTRRELLEGSGLFLAALGTGCTVSARTIPRDGVRLAKDVQERSFRFFWETANPENGLVPDRWPSPSFSSIAAVGFALTAYPIGVANRWITRAEARERTLTTLLFFSQAPQGDGARGVTGHNGLFYHFLDMHSGERYRSVELSTIDTALLIAGMLFAQSWFDGDDLDERRIRSLVDSIYARVDWRWASPRSPFVSMGWHPESGFIDADWDTYSECMLIYLLALASPDHPIEPECWDQWTARFEPQWGSKWGRPHIQYPPLFVHQYSHLWVDFRGVADKYMKAKGIDYFENSRRATHAQRAYAVANPGGFAGYGDDIWGITACDGPGDFKRTIGGRERQFFGYAERGPGSRDDGTIAPTAAVTALAFAPEIALPAVEALHRAYGSAVYGQYGFLDAFNPTLTDPSARLDHGRIAPGAGWIGPDYLGIDQGPIVVGIENWRTGLVWATMRKNVYIRRGLERAGFKGGWLG